MSEPECEHHHNERPSRLCPTNRRRLKKAAKPVIQHEWNCLYRRSASPKSRYSTQSKGVRVLSGTTIHFHFSTRSGARPLPFGLGAAAAAALWGAHGICLWLAHYLCCDLLRRGSTWQSRQWRPLASSSSSCLFHWPTRARSRLLRAQAHQCLSDRLPAVVSPAPVGASSVREPTNRRVGSRRGQVRRRLVTYHRPFHWRRSSAHSCEVAKSEQGRSHCCALPSPSPRQSSRLTILASRSKLHSHTVPLDDPRLFQQWPQAE